MVPDVYESPLAEGTPHLRGDHGRTLEHARREGKPDLPSVLEAPETCGFRIREGAPTERDPGHGNTKPRARPAEQPRAGFGELERPLFFLATDFDGRRLVGVLPLFANPLDRDENRGNDPREAHDERCHRALLTAGFVEGEVPGKRATRAAHDGKHRQGPHVGKTCDRWNDEAELGTHQAQPDGTLGCCANRLGGQLLGVSRARRCRQR